MVGFVVFVGSEAAFAAAAEVDASDGPCGGRNGTIAAYGGHGGADLAGELFNLVEGVLFPAVLKLEEGVGETGAEVGGKLLRVKICYLDWNPGVFTSAMRLGSTALLFSDSSDSSSKPGDESVEVVEPGPFNIPEAVLLKPVVIGVSGKDPVVRDGVVGSGTEVIGSRDISFSSLWFTGVVSDSPSGVGGVVSVVAEVFGAIEIGGARLAGKAFGVSSRTLETEEVPSMGKVGASSVMMCGWGSIGDSVAGTALRASRSLREYPVLFLVIVQVFESGKFSVDRC